MLKLMVQGLDFTFVDVGGYGDLPLEWRELSDCIKVIGFEPLKDECNRLRRQFPERCYLDTGLGATNGPSSFYETNQPVYSSIYPPNEEYFRDIGKLAHITPVIERKIELDTLDNALAGKGVVDFLKLDVQGAEWDILQGSKNVLPSITGVVTEFYFDEAYKGQKVFSDIDVYLREAGFIFIDFVFLNHWRSQVARDNGWPRGRIMAGDALYIRKDSMAGDASHSDIKKAAFILAVYGQYDYAHNLLMLLGRGGDATCIKLLLNKITQNRTIWSRLSAWFCRSFQTTEADMINKILKVSVRN